MYKIKWQGGFYYPHHKREGWSFFFLTFVGGEGLSVIVFLLNLKTDTLNAGRGWKCIYNSHAMPLGQNLAFLYSISVSA